MEQKFEGKITGASIPSEDVTNWFKTLHEAGFSGEEIDDFFARMNKDFLKAKGKEFARDFLEKEFENMTNAYYAEHKKMPQGANKYQFIEKGMEELGFK